MTFDAQRLHGIIPPLVTPFDRAGELNLRGAGQLANYLLEAGVQGIFIGGTTGEAATLTVEELARLTEVTVEAVGGRVPVLVGVTATSTRSTLQRVKAITRYGPDAVVAHIPYYYPHTQNEIYFFYKELAKGSPLPVMLYNIPQTTKIPLAVETILRLAAEEPNIIGYKDSSNNLTDFRQLVIALQTIRPDFRVFLGTDILQDTAIQMGACGTIPSLGNLFPEPLVQAYQAARKGDWPEAGRWVEIISKLTGIYAAGKESAIGNGIASLKYGLTIKGVEAGQPRPPLKPLDADGEELVDKMVAQAIKEHAYFS